MTELGFTRREEYSADQEVLTVNCVKSRGFRYLKNQVGKSWERACIRRSFWTQSGHIAPTHRECVVARSLVDGRFVLTSRPVFADLPSHDPGLAKRADTR